MRHGIVIALLLFAVAAWIGAVVSVIAGKSQFLSVAPAPLRRRRAPA